VSTEPCPGGIPKGMPKSDRGSLSPGAKLRGAQQFCSSKDVFHGARGTDTTPGHLSMENSLQSQVEKLRLRRESTPQTWEPPHLSSWALLTNCPPALLPQGPGKEA
jgi:hypothetical protein